MQPNAIYLPSSSLPASQGHSHISAVLLGLRLHQQQQQQQQQPQNETAASSGRGGGEDEGDGYDSDAEITMKVSVHLCHIGKWHDVNDRQALTE